MHDIDRTQLEYANEAQGFETEHFGNGEFEGAWGGATSGVLGEADEMQLASELLAVNSEAELDQFLGGLLGTIGGALGKLVPGGIGKALGGVLKGVAGKALGRGGRRGGGIGRGIASAFGNLLGFEAEGPGAESHEFEGAQQFIRMAADTVARAAGMPAGTDPRAVAQTAAVAAARKFAPGLLGAVARAAPVHGAQSGRWVRNGRTITLYGI